MDSANVLEQVNAIRKDLASLSKKVDALMLVAVKIDALDGHLEKLNETLELMRIKMRQG